jgi:hypothetical protein
MTWFNLKVDELTNIDRGVGAEKKERKSEEEST